MPIKIAISPISDTQKNYLLIAQSRPTSSRAIEALLNVCCDEDITSGREAVHPEWAKIFTVNIRQLKKQLKASQLVQLEQIFGQAAFYDPAVLKINLSASRLVFLLGAGASKPRPSGIPTVSELLVDLLQRARKLNRQDLDRLADFCEEANITNIEDLLTAAQLSEFCSRNPTVLRLIEFLIYRKGRDDSETQPYPTMSHSRGFRLPIGDLSAVAFLQDTLQVLFGLLSSRMLPAKPNAAHKAIAKYAHANKSTSIVTTNYDCCMDLALGTEGRDFSYLVDFMNKQSSENRAQAKSSLIKLHGSLNWFYCDTCQQVHQIDIKKTIKEYLTDQGCYSVIAVCRECGGQRRGLIVPPLAMKFDMAPPLTPLIGRTQESFNAADIIIAVGFSFADADLYISRMLTKALQSSKETQLVVFDPDYTVVEKLRRQMSLHVSGFNPGRILRVGGDCSEMLPAFLARRLKFIKTKPMVEFKDKAIRVPTKERQIQHRTKASRRRPKGRS
ncbi:MAG: SIR2 family protein [Thermodesulfovibrionia bacterium]|nr:SIR2 family protein [Thermodesulfovibrionia bacterium]MCK5306354.1 SIR2 family protein [Candidatus Omnitrophota bacterium]